MTLTKLLCQYTVATGASAIRAKAASTATASVALGDYFITDDGTASDLLKAITDALASACGGTWEARISSGVVGIRCTTHSWDILWTDALTKFDYSVLGCTSSSLSGSAGTWDDADVQHKYGWYSTQYIESDSKPYNIAEVTQFKTSSNAVFTMSHGTAGTARELSFAFEPLHKTHPTSGYTNQDFLSFHSLCLDGTAIRFYPDVSTTTAYVAYTNAAGYYSGVLDVESCRAMRPQRNAPGISLYSWQLKILGT